MMKILYISAHIDRIDKSGITIGTKSNFGVLENIVGKNNLEKMYIENAYSSKFDKFINVLLYQNYGGISRKIEKEILSKVINNEYDLIYVDVSFWGNLIKKLYKLSKKTIAYYVDVESQRMKSIAKLHLSEKKYINAMTSLIFSRIAYINEKKTNKFANEIIGLSDRDSKLSLLKYGREFDYVIPAFMPDDYQNQPFLDQEIAQVKNLLFVGVSSYEPNISGLNWFIKNVMPFINAKLNIVGFGMEKFKDLFESQNSNVNVIGTVEDIENAYENSDLIVAPIFSGGGMKIKVLEALKYGKSILGSKEAFQGFDNIDERIGKICYTNIDFINSINNLNFLKYNQFSRKLFIDYYSEDSALKKFSAILKNFKNGNN